MAHAENYPSIRVEGRQLMVDFDEDGVYQPYFIKGAGYQPYPIGRHPSDWGWPEAGDPRPDNIYDDPVILNRDFELLRAMNANTIRIWKGDDTTQPDGRFPVKLTQQTLDLAQSYGLKVIAGFWVDPPGWQECTSDGLVYHTTLDYTDPSVRTDIKTRFEAYVEVFKDHPAILFWAIGNENNLHLDSNNPDQIRAWYSLVNEMAALAHTVDDHPVAVVNGDLSYIGDESLGTTDAQMSALDIWGINVYRGESFGDFFQTYAGKSGKPLWISEFGVDAWHTVDVTDPNNGYEDQAIQAQWTTQLWEEISQNSLLTVGATLMEYSDEWWQPYEWLCGEESPACNSTQNHYGHGPIDTSCPQDGTIDWYPPSPDQFFNGEWFGIMAVEPNPAAQGADITAPRLSYHTLQERFALINEAPVFDEIDDQTVPEGETLSFFVSARAPQEKPLSLGAKLNDGRAVASVGALFTDQGEGSGYFEWTPNAEQGGTYGLIFSATDGKSVVYREMTITVEDVLKKQPVALSQHITLDANTSTPVTLTATDVDNDTLTYRIITWTQHGTLNGTGSDFIYAPDPDYVGVDEFTFVANDGTADSNVAHVWFTIKPVGTTVVTVGDGQDYSTIQQAIDAVPISLPNNMEIWIYSGIYPEKINLSGRNTNVYTLTLKGLDSGVVISGGDRVGDYFSIKNNSGRIRVKDIRTK